MRAPDNVSGAPETPRTAAGRDHVKEMVEIIVHEWPVGRAETESSWNSTIIAIEEEARAEALREVLESLSREEVQVRASITNPDDARRLYANGVAYACIAIRNRLATPSPATPEETPE